MSGGPPATTSVIPTDLESSAMAVSSKSSAKRRISLADVPCDPHANAFTPQGHQSFGGTAYFQDVIGATTRPDTPVSNIEPSIAHATHSSTTSGKGGEVLVKRINSLRKKLQSEKAKGEEAARQITLFKGELEQKGQQVEDLLKDNEIIRRENTKLRATASVVELLEASPVPNAIHENNRVELQRVLSSSKKQLNTEVRRVIWDLSTYRHKCAVLMQAVASDKAEKLEAQTWLKQLIKQHQDEVAREKEEAKRTMERLKESERKCDELDKQCIENQVLHTREARTLRQQLVKAEGEAEGLKQQLMDLSEAHKKTLSTIEGSSVNGSSSSSGNGRSSSSGGVNINGNSSSSSSGSSSSDDESELVKGLRAQLEDSKITCKTLAKRAFHYKTKAETIEMPVRRIHVDKILKDGSFVSAQLTIKKNASTGEVLLGVTSDDFEFEYTQDIQTIKVHFLEEDPTDTVIGGNDSQSSNDAWFPETGPVPAYSKAPSKIASGSSDSTDTVTSEEFTVSPSPTKGTKPRCRWLVAFRDDYSKCMTFRSSLTDRNHLFDIMSQFCHSTPSTSPPSTVSSRESSPKKSHGQDVMSSYAKLIRKGTRNHTH